MSTESAELAPIQTTAIAEYSPTAAALADIAKRMAKVVYDVSTPIGMAAAKADRAEVRDLRVALEKKRVEIKAPALARCNEIDTEARRITAELVKYETPPDVAIKKREAEIETERQAKIAAEVKRVADIHARIRDMSNGITLLCATSHLSVIENWIEKTDAVAIDDSFAEFRGNAEIEKTDVLRRLRELHAAATVHQQAEDALKAEQERLAAERAEQEARDAEIRATREAEQRAEDARRAEERAKFEEEQRQHRAEQAAEAARLKKIADDQETANAAERERLANQARLLAEEQRKLNAAREKLEVVVPVAPPEIEKPAEFAHQFASFPRPSFEVIVAVVARQFQASEEQVRTWIMPVPESER